MPEDRTDHLWKIGDIPDTTRVATCPHRCDCSCHTSGGKHMTACCSGCGGGHSMIATGQMSDHLRDCHLIL